MNKSVGILTYHDSDNFGSVLQAYALSAFLLRNGWKCEIIDFRKKEVQELYYILQPLDSRYHALTNAYALLHMGQLRMRRQRYEAFRQKYLPLSRKRYTRNDELCDCTYDAYVVGSDQVWNTEIIDFDEAYMLSFAHGRKIAYAVSFGPHRLGRKQLEPYLAYLRDFDCISVRERQSHDVIELELKLKAKLVCDPVCLLDKQDWKAVEQPCGKEIKYLFCYFPGGTMQEIDRFSQQKAKELQCVRSLIMPEWRNLFRQGQKNYACGPAEFLYLLRHAEAVCTSSFHGTAFSLLFDKSVYVYDSGEDSRISTLLSLADQNKIAHCDKHMLIVEPGALQTEKFCQYREEAKQFLMAALTM